MQVDPSKFTPGTPITIRFTGGVANQYTLAEWSRDGVTVVMKDEWAFFPFHRITSIATQSFRPTTPAINPETLEVSHA